MTQQVHLITYANEKYELSMQKLLEEAHAFKEFTTITGYRPNNITPLFARRFHSVLQQPRGAGYWIWKFDIIRQKLDQIANNDILVYLDGGCSVNINGKKRYHEYIDMLNNSEYGFLSLSLGPEYIYTTRQILNYFGETPESKMGQDKQLMAGIMLMKKCPHTYMILDKCMELLNHDPKLITDHYNKENQHPNFKDNRHDQSILSVVRNKYGSCIIPDETFTSKNWSELHHIPFLSRRRLVRDIYNKPIDQDTTIIMVPVIIAFIIAFIIAIMFLINTDIFKKIKHHALNISKGVFINNNWMKINMSLL